MQNAAGVQGMPANQESHAQFSNLTNVENNAFSSIPATFKYILALAALFLFTASSGYSQEYDTLDVATLNYSLEIPNVTLNTGDTAVYHFKIGTAGAQVEDAIGLEIAFDVTANAEFPTTPDFRYRGSWLLNTSNKTTSYTLDPTTGTIQLNATRTDDNPQTGYGKVFSIALVAAVDNVHAEDLIASSGGGYVIIENVDFKTLSPSIMEPEMPANNPQFSMFPNPCQTEVNLNWEGILPISAMVITPTGNTVKRLSGFEIQSGKMSVTSLPDGFHILVARYPKGLTKTHNFIVRK